MTPQELWAAIDARWRERGLKWWQVAVALDVSQDAIRKMRHGIRCQAAAERAPAWLEGRLRDQPRKE